MKKLHKMINNAMAYAKNKDSVLSYMMKVYSHFKHRYYSEQWKDAITRPIHLLLLTKYK